MVEAERGKSEVRRGRRDKNDHIDRLRPGPRIDGHLSPASVISPTNHDVTSTGQYHTLQASSSYAGLPAPARTARRGHRRSSSPSIRLLITGVHATPESNKRSRTRPQIHLGPGLGVGGDFAAWGHFRLAHVAIHSEAD